MKKKTIKNYIILSAIFLAAILVTLYLCRWYKVYDDYKKQEPVIRGTLQEITSVDLEHYIYENPTITIYMCTSSDMVCRNYEKSFKKLINSENLNESIIYLNLSDVNSEEYVNEFNEKFKPKTKLTTYYPALITFEDGKVKYILQGNEEQQLTISKTKEYIELNHIGEEGE